MNFISVNLSKFNFSMKGKEFESEKIIFSNFKEELKEKTNDIEKEILIKNELMNFLKESKFNLINFEDNKNIFLIEKKIGSNVLKIYLSHKNIPEMSETQKKYDESLGKKLFRIFIKITIFKIH